MFHDIAMKRRKAVLQDAFYHPVKRNYSESLTDLMKKPLDFTRYCFAYRSDLISSSQEDIIPLWLSRELSLKDENLTIGNSTPFPFRKMKIPCCIKCNNGRLSRLENGVKKILDKNVQEINALDEQDLFYWALKIYLGLSIQSTQLSNNLRVKGASTIMSQKYLDYLKPLFDLFLTLKYPALFQTYQPYSVLTFRINIEDFKTKFGLVTHPYLPSIMLAYKNIGLIVCFDDFNVVEYMALDRYQYVRLWPTTFGDLIYSYSMCLTYLEYLKNQRSYTMFIEPDHEMARFCSLLSTEERSHKIPKYDDEKFGKHLQLCYDAIRIKKKP